MVSYEQKAKALRKSIVSMIYTAQAGHPGGSLSVIDILTVLYYGGFIRFDAKNPASNERDYFILSKAHASPALYSVLADLGFFSADEHFHFRQVDALLQGHVSNKVPGVEICGGSLGQGLSVATGIALGRREKRVYCVLGDGELQEGQNWEAIMTANHYKLENLTAIVDRNGLQIDGATEDVMQMGSVADKFKAFGWNTISIDGHNFSEIEKSLQDAQKSDKPTAIIASTVKGKGISYMEGKFGWHGKAPNEEQFQQAITELNA